MTNDPHAENRKLYAQDALETDTPWERWEFNAGILHDEQWKGWHVLDQPPKWYSEYQYRRIPQTLNINGHEVPMPLYARPDGVEVVYAPIVLMPHLYVAMRTWAIAHDEWRLGIYHLTAEAAVLHAKAILSFSERKKP
jgi:hypothetical protein